MRITYSTPQQPEANCVGDRYRETLTQGRDYEVVALEFSSWVENPRLQCYIFDDDGFSWPRPYPLDIFMITDARMSRQWIVRTHDLHSGQLTMISFPAWADDPYFYDRILNDDAAACAHLDEFLRGERLRAQEDSLVDLRTALLAAGAPENSIEQVLTLLTHGEPELAREDIAALMDGKAQNQWHQQAVERALQLHSGSNSPGAEDWAGRKE